MKIDGALRSTLVCQTIFPSWRKSYLSPFLLLAAAFIFTPQVALSGDGHTAVIGTFGKSTAYIFTEENNVWTEAQELTAPPGSSSFGLRVATNGDGGIVLVGAPRPDSTGAVYVYMRTDSGWALQQELSVPGSVSFGDAVQVTPSGALR